MEKSKSWWRLANMAFFSACVMLVSSPALAGYSTGAPAGLVSAGEGALKPIVDTMTSPLLGLVAGLAMMICFGASLFGQVGEAVKGALRIAGVFCAILMTPSIIAKIAQGAGALV